MQVLPFVLQISQSGVSISRYGLYRSADADAERVYSNYRSEYDYISNDYTYLYVMNEGETPDATYYFRMRYSVSGEISEKPDVTHYVKSVTVDGKPFDVKTLFTKGCPANYSKEPVAFVLQYTEDYLSNPGGTLTFRVQAVETVEPSVGSYYTYLNVYEVYQEAYDEDNRTQSYWDYSINDAYSQYGYQTLFLMNWNGDEVPDTVYPTYSTPNSNDTVYLTLKEMLSCETTLTLTIRDNTDSNVWNTPTQGQYHYNVLTAVGTATGNSHYEMNSYKDRDFRSEGPYNEFCSFYLDGKRLTRDTDYTAKEGSTVITIKAQTLWT